VGTYAYFMYKHESTIISDNTNGVCQEGIPHTKICWDP